MEILYPRCAGLDVHEETVVACARLATGSGEVAREVRTFGATTAGLLELAAWLTAQGCAHVAMELDWQEGVFFDSDGRDLLCSTHGATYDAASGRCIGGPCNGSPLVKLRLEVRDGLVYFIGFDDD